MQYGWELLILFSITLRKHVRLGPVFLLLPPTLLVQGLSVRQVLCQYFIIYLYINLCHKEGEDFLNKSTLKYAGAD